MFELLRHYFERLNKVKLLRHLTDIHNLNQLNNHNINPRINTLSIITYHNILLMDITADNLFLYS